MRTSNLSLSLKTDLSHQQFNSNQFITQIDLFRAQFLWHVYYFVEIISPLNEQLHIITIFPQKIILYRKNMKIFIDTTTKCLWIAVLSRFERICGAKIGLNDLNTFFESFQKLINEIARFFFKPIWLLIYCCCAKKIY